MEKNLTFEQIFLAKEPDFEFLLTRMRCALDVEEVTFDDINSVNMVKFKKYMTGETSNNTLKTYFAIVKSVVNSIANDGLISNNKCLTELKVKSTPSEHVFCTEEEMERMDAYFDRLVSTPDHSKVEQDCLCLFLMENVTGARASDCIKLSKDNIRDGKLTYVSQKTKQKSVMPVHKNLLKYLKYKPKKDYSRMTKSRIIKACAEKCGITQEVTLFYRGKLRKGPKYKFICTHTARRNFATHLALRGAPITEICQFMNHRQNINQTLRYIIPDMDNVSNESMSFFNG